MPDNYDINPMRVIEEDLPVPPYDPCSCPCHTLFGLETPHIVACCGWPVNDNVRS